MLAARDAVRLLLGREALKLVAVVLVGWWMIRAGTTPPGTVFGGGLKAIADALGALSVLTGYALVYGGALALLVKLVYDAVALANENANANAN